MLDHESHMSNVGVSIHVTGIVQGVGFRPFVYNLAETFALNGWVRNTSAGVDIVLEGKISAIDDFITLLNSTPPPLSKVEKVTVIPIQVVGYDGFEIIQSQPIPGSFQPISPDVCICPDCLQELFDPNDRRFRYPFINCTNCGPRYTIIKDIPYDRPSTTMADFRLCPTCQKEYDDPHNRRFHAQPIACPVCGPKVWMDTTAGKTIAEQDHAINLAREMIYGGKIIAIKGLGGFHLACDATNSSAVKELRNRKLRIDKPFALMLPSLSSAEKHCQVSENDLILLNSYQRPIVILSRNHSSNIVRDVAPRQDTIGVMLPYTPLHYLLFANESTQSENLEYDDLCLVMTSGNISEEPIASQNGEAHQKLSSLADAFLMHDRPIHIRCDDSVIRSSPASNLYPIRRSRSYAPSPISLQYISPPLLATGGELKNTFCIARDEQAFMSHHIGDMENFETYQSFVDGIAHMEKLFRIKPTAIACDLHPDYLATRYSIERSTRENLGLIYVQHHHAHIASCMVDNGLLGEEPVIGISFDGTGYGEDGAIWGGEFLISDFLGYKRAYHMKYFPLPGGDLSIRKPVRTALAYLWFSGIEWHEYLPCTQSLCAEELTVLKSQLSHMINAPWTSSMGRLFDAVASLIGINQHINYEAQAAIELEAIVDPLESTSYPYEINTGDSIHPGMIDPSPMIKFITTDVLSDVPASTIAARFHNTIARMVFDVANTIRSQTGINNIVLSGGVWQNITLLTNALKLLTQEHFRVYTHHQVPTNDGGLALGQIAIAAHQSAVKI